ncbi:MAG: hypothetical protein N2484_12695 [Clostridia bacterium]|nr:hypothetical protein [Clostridia bacterium]
MKIEAFFSEMKTANEAVKKLKEAGFENAYVDMNDHYIDDRNVETNLAGTEMSTSLTGLVLQSDSHGIGKGKSPLNGASPMVSGFGRFEEVADIACKVIVDVKESDSSKVKSLMQELGGSLESPNVAKPKLAYDKEYTLYKSIEEIDKEI